MIDGIKQKYMALEPKKKMMVWLVGIPSILLVGYIIVAPGEIVKKVPTSNVSEKGFFDTDSEEMTVPALSTKINSLESKLDTTNQRFSALAASQKRVEDLVENMSGDDQSVRSFYEINRQLAEMSDNMKRLMNGESIRSAATDAPIEPVFIPADSDEADNDTEETVPEPIRITPPDKIDYSVKRTEIPNDPLAFVEQASKRSSVKQVTDDNMFIPDGSDQRLPNPVATTVISHDEKAKATIDEENKAVEYRGKRVLAGSVIPFILINGFDAPTGKANSSDPVSASVRISGPALLPNGYTVDLTGCIVTNLVKGNEATERASLRPDRMTCKYDYGEVDVAIQGYASGKDGSAGLRGRLVSKAQKALIYGTFAGVAEGLGNAFGGGSQSGGFGSLGGDPFALPSSDQALRSSATSGLAAGSEFLTDYYKTKLDSLYDIIEIKPLIKGNIHVLTTFETKLLGQTSTSPGVSD